MMADEKPLWELADRVSKHIRVQSEKLRNSCADTPRRGWQLEAFHRYRCVERCLGLAEGVLDSCRIVLDGGGAMGGAMLVTS